MARMGRYVKAYIAKEFQAFAGFAPALAALKPNENGVAREALCDDDVLFVHEDFAVTDGIYRDENILFESEAEDWKTFCVEALGFAVPDDIAALPDEAAVA